MKKTLIQIFVSVVVLLVGTFVGTIVEKYRSESESRIRYLDKEIAKSQSILSQPKIPGKTLEVLLDGEPINNISQVAISIYNYTDKDFANVPVYVELIPTSNKPIQVISKRAVGANDLPEAIVELKNVKHSEIQGGLRDGFEIKNANRTENYDKVFNVSYLIEGDALPEVKIVADKQSVGLRNYSYRHLEKDSWMEIASVAVVSILIISAYVAFFVIAFKFQRKKIIKHDEEFKSKLIENLRKPETGEKFGVDPLKAADISIYLLRMFQKHRWEKTPRIIRFLSPYQNPDKNT